MSEKQMEEMKEKYEWDTKERTEISLREMVNSVWCYHGNCYTNKYITNYFNEKELEEERVWEIVKDQLNYLNNNCRIVENVYTDGEGLTYNSIIEN